jgi:hypothetical protein
MQRQLATYSAHKVQPIVNTVVNKIAILNTELKVFRNALKTNQFQENLKNVGGTH